MGTVRDLVTLSIVVGFGIAVLGKPDAAVKVINSVSASWFNIVRTVSNRDPYVV